MNLAELLDDLAAVPSLRDAACRGHSELFDATIPGSGTREQVAQAQQLALQICRTCPALPGCRRWVDSLPAWKRPPGVVAGRRNARRPRAPGTPIKRTRWH